MNFFWDFASRAHCTAGTVPYTFVNNSPYPDDQVYVAVIRIIGGHVWIDGKTSESPPDERRVTIPSRDR